MNEVLSFFQDVFTGNGVNSKPVGLTSFKTSNNTKKVIIKKPSAKNELRLSDLMRKPH